MVRLEYILDSWKTIRQDTAQAVEDLPGGLDFRATPDMMTFGETARHILDASHALTGLMLAGVDDFAVPTFRERLKPHMTTLGEKPDAATLARELRERFDERAAELARRAPDFWSEMMTRFDGWRVTRLEMLETVKEHELTHRAQLFFALRLNGIVPPTTRRRQAKK